MSFLMTAEVKMGERALMRMKATPWKMKFTLKTVSSIS